MPTSSSAKASVRSGSSDASSALLPKGWLPNITFITGPVLSKALTQKQLQGLYVLTSEAPHLAPRKVTSGPCSLVRITPITIPIHPANGQYGIVASQHLAPDTFILLYLGFLHDPSDTNHSSDYDLSLDRELELSVDASTMGNEARFINDYRGVRPDGPNAEFRDCWVEVGARLEKRIGVFVLTAGRSGKRAKGIAKGEEILVSYGKGFWSSRSKVDDVVAVRGEEGVVAGG